MILTIDVLNLVMGYLILKVFVCIQGHQLNEYFFNDDTIKIFFSKNPNAAPIIFDPLNDVIRKIIHDVIARKAGKN